MPKPPPWKPRVSVGVARPLDHRAARQLEGWAPSKQEAAAGTEGARYLVQRIVVYSIGTDWNSEALDYTASLVVKSPRLLRERYGLLWQEVESGERAQRIPSTAKSNRGSKVPDEPAGAAVGCSHSARRRETLDPWPPPSSPLPAQHPHALPAYLSRSRPNSLRRQVAVDESVRTIATQTLPGRCSESVRGLRLTAAMRPRHTHAQS